MTMRRCGRDACRAKTQQAGRCGERRESASEYMRERHRPIDAATSKNSAKGARSQLGTMTARMSWELTSWIDVTEVKP